MGLPCIMARHRSRDRAFLYIPRALLLSVARLDGATADASLAGDLREAVSFQNAHGFPRLKNWQGPHYWLPHVRLSSDKHCLHPRVPVLKEHTNNIAEVLA